jgi:hypothetical protein
MSQVTQALSGSQFSWRGSSENDSCLIETLALTARSYQKSEAGSSNRELGQAILNTALLTLLDDWRVDPTSKDRQTPEELLQAAELQEDISFAAFLDDFKHEPLGGKRKVQLAEIYNHPARRTFGLVYQEEPGD